MILLCYFFPFSYPAMPLFQINVEEELRDMTNAKLEAENALTKFILDTKVTLTLSFFPDIF